MGRQAGPSNAARRVGRRTVAVVAITVASLPLLVRPAGAAGPELVPSSRTIAVGDTIKVSDRGCSGDDDDRFANIELLVGSGAEERRAGVVDQGVVAVPGWVDQNQPARLVGQCIESDDDSHGRFLFTFPPVPIDIVAGASDAISPTFTLDRTTGAGGTVLTGSGSGCSAGVDAAVIIDRPTPDGPDLDAANGLSGGVETSAGTFEVDLALMTFGLEDLAMDDDDPETAAQVQVLGAPLPEGTYRAQFFCSGPSGPNGEDDPPLFLAEPITITVVGSRPSRSIAATIGDGTLEVTGSECPDGQLVSATASASRLEGEQPAPQAFTASPLGGRWAISVPRSDDTYFIQVTADCGDPHNDGFRYAAIWVMGLPEGSLDDLPDPPFDPMPDGPPILLPPTPTEAIPHPSDAAPPATPMPGSPTFTG